MSTRLPTALVLASASSASAGIVVFDINPDFQANHDDISMLRIGTLNFSNGSFADSPYGLLIDNSGAYTNSFYLINNYSFRSGSTLLPTGTIIGSGDTFGTFAQFEHYLTATPIGTHYIALKDTDNNFYGWIEAVATASNDPLFNDVTFTRFAFNDIAGQSILAGQTTAIPEASTLGLVGGLFSLAAAAHIRRRKQKQAAASDKFLALAAGEKLN